MKKVNAFLLLLLVHYFSIAQTTIKLYAGKAPGSSTWNWSEKELPTTPGNLILYNIVEPELIVYPAPRDKANGTSIVIAPGGGFHILSIENEGTEVAKKLNEKGITAFVYKYRLVRCLTNNPFQELMPLLTDLKKLDSINAHIVEMATKDGIEAMKYIRTHATDLNIDPQKIGFMGFSAGGTVTMSVILSAPAEFKPNFVAPIYLYKNAVLGTTMPSKETPIFLAVASDDQLKLVSHSIKFYDDWISANQPAELHIYENGGHGFGISKHNTTSDQWFSDFENWLTKRGLIKQ